MATEATDLTTTKLQLENDSLKRRLAKYATTLEELTLHAKREISSSARARDEALAAAGESITLREAMSDMESALADAHAQRDAAQTALQQTADQLRHSQEKAQLLETKLQQHETSNRSVNISDSAQGERERSLETKLREFEDVAEVLRTDLRARDDLVNKNQNRIKELEQAETHLEQRLAHAEAAVQETESALRHELDQALKELGERNTLLSEMKKREKEAVDAKEAVQERDVLRCNVNQLQEELEQSTEMLTRAAIDALGDKGRIRKLEESLGKTKDQLTVSIAEKVDRDTKISAFGHAVARLEKELDAERTSKRSLADQCHKYQMHIHQQDKIVASKTRAYEELSTDRNDRAFQADRVSLELSNAKNALAKKESEFVNLSAEYEDARAQLKTTARDLEGRHLEVSTMRKELATAVDQIKDLKQEKERFKATLSELQVSRRQLQELSVLAAEKDEELSTTQRHYTTLKTEAAESGREKKRLSDMLSDVSGDLKRANQELDILRNMRKGHETLAARISTIGETSTRELSAMRQTQTEQATALAKNTVDEYSRRLEEMQTAAQQEIANTVANQLRADVMPQLMRAVDAKAKHLVQSLARHVEAFTLDTETSFQAPKYAEPSATVTNANADSIQEPHTNVATDYGSGVPSESRSAPTSAFQSAPPSAPLSAIPYNFIPSSTDSPPVSVPDVSRADSMEGSTALPSSMSPEPSIERAPPYPVMSPVESPTGSPIEAQSEDGEISREVAAVREIAVPPLTEELAEKAIEEPAEEPIVEPAEEPVAELAEEPVAEPAEEPIAEPAEEPIAEPAEEPIAEPAEEPIAESAEEPSEESPEAPESEPIAEPDSTLETQVNDREVDFTPELAEAEPVEPEAVEPVEPEAVEPVEPEAAEPEAAGPEAAGPEAAEPEAAEPEAAEPEAVGLEPEAVELETFEPEAVEPEPAEPKPAEPEPVEPELAEPEPAETEPVEPEPVEPEPAEPEPAEPEPAEREPAEPESVEPEAEAVEPEAVEPEAVEPEPVEPIPVVAMEQEDGSRDMPVFEELEGIHEEGVEPTEEEIYEERGEQYEFDEGDTGAVAEDVAGITEAEVFLEAGDAGITEAEVFPEAGDVPEAVATPEAGEGIGIDEETTEATEATEATEENAEDEDVAEGGQRGGALDSAYQVDEELDLTEGAPQDLDDMGEEGNAGVGGVDVYGEAIVEELDDSDEGYIHGMPPEFAPQDEEDEDEDVEGEYEVGEAELGYQEATVLVFVEKDAGGLEAELAAAEAEAEAQAEVMQAAAALESASITDEIADEAEPEGEAGDEVEPADESEFVQYDAMAEPSEEPLEDMDTSPEPVEEPMDEGEIVDMGEGAEDKSDVGEDAADMGLGTGDIPDIGDEGYPQDDVDDGVHVDEPVNRELDF